MDAFAKFWRQIQHDFLKDYIQAAKQNKKVGRDKMFLRDLLGQLGKCGRDQDEVS